MFEDFSKVIFRSIKLDKNLYKDPNTFRELSLYYAGLIMVLDGVAGAIALSTLYKTNIIFSGVTALSKLDGMGSIDLCNRNKIIS